MLGVPRLLIIPTTLVRLRPLSSVVESDFVEAVVSLATFAADVGVRALLVRENEDGGRAVSELSRIGPPRRSSDDLLPLGT